MKTNIGAILLTLLIAACSSAPGGSAGPVATDPPAGLSGATFLSTSVTVGRTALDLVPGTRIRLVFGADGNLGASAGCNMIGGTWRLDNGVLRFEGGGMTEMGCDEPRHAQDDWLSKFLGSAPTVALAGPELILTSGDTVVRFADREVADPDLPLIGPVWKVTTIFSGDTASSLPDNAVATFQFTADGRLLLQTGCNDAGGRVMVAGDTMAFGDIVTTDKACLGAAGELEKAVIKVVGADVVTWSIDAAGLTLRAGDAGLGLTGR